MKTSKMKRFLKYYKPHWKLFAADMLCAFGLAASDLVLPVLSETMVNDVIVSKDTSMVITIAAVLVGIYILRYFLSHFINYWGHVMGVRLEFDLRKDIFEHIQTLPHAWFDRMKTGKIMSRIVNDLDNLAEFAHHGPEDVFISAVMFGGSILIMIQYEWRLALVVALFVPFMMHIAMRQRKKMSQSFKRMRETIADVNATLEDSISGVRVVKAFANEGHEIKRFERGNMAYRDAVQTSFKVMANFFSGMNFSIGLLNTTVLTLGGYFVIGGSMNVGELVAFLMLVNFFMKPVQRLMSFTEQYQRAMAGFDRFIEIMDTEPAIVDREDAHSPTTISGDITLEDVTFAYENDASKVLHNLNLSVASGKTLALVGPSGGGKTTLIHLIPRFYDVSEGAICIDGQDIRDLSLKSLRKNVGIVQQNVFLFSGTVKENIAYGRIDASHEEIVEAAKNAKIHDFIMGLPEGYDSYVGEKGVMLSGGQKQRISIARVFLKNPPILILDEATSALDNETEIQIQTALEALSKGRTTIVIAHRLSTIRSADEIIVLTDKGIAEQGDHESLLVQGGIYSGLFHAQFKGYIPDSLQVAGTNVS